jgi:hypothetical protein
MFISNKYTTWYYNIVNNANGRILPNGIYTESHHIIPKSLSGPNSKNNLVILTAKEHFICHLLLTKMVHQDCKKKMIYAFWRMANCTGKRYRPTARIYEIARQEFIQAQLGHPNYNKFHTIETRKKLSKLAKERLSTLTPEENAQRIKNSCSSPSSWTNNRKAKISNALTGITRSAETRNKMSIAKQNLTPAQKLKCGDSNRGKSWKLIDGKRIWIDKENQNY